MPRKKDLKKFKKLLVVIILVKFWRNLKKIIPINIKKDWKNQKYIQKWNLKLSKTEVTNNITIAVSVLLISKNLFKKKTN